MNLYTKCSIRQIDILDLVMAFLLNGEEQFGKTKDERRGEHAHTVCP